MKLQDSSIQNAVSIDPSQLQDVICECGNQIFIPGVRVKRLSAILSPSGKEESIAIQTLVCLKCNKEIV